MKIFSKIILGFIFCFTGLLLFTCSKQKRNEYVTYEGTVFDTLGANPVANVVVKLYGCSCGGDQSETCARSGCKFYMGESTSDANGHFSIHEKASRVNSYFIFLVKNGQNWGVNTRGMLGSQSNLHLALYP